METLYEEDFSEWNWNALMVDGQTHAFGEQISCKNGWIRFDYVNGRFDLLSKCGSSVCRIWNTRHILCASDLIEMKHPKASSSSSSVVVCDTRNFSFNSICLSFWFIVTEPHSDEGVFFILFSSFAGSPLSIICLDFFFVGRWCCRKSYFVRSLRRCRRFISLVCAQTWLCLVQDLSINVNL